ncbi:MAG: GDYXXLXY domain-containing protein [Verrucomicrobiota bacterium]
MKSLPIIIFAITALAQWGAPLSQIWTYEGVLTKGTLIRVKCAAPDPYDPLRGRYLAVRPEQTNVPLPEGMEAPDEQMGYVSITTGADGLATLSSLSFTKPTSGDYLYVRVHSSYDRQASIDWPFERYYLNEELAPEADEWFAENIRNTKGIIAEVRVLNGRAVLADLTLDGKPFREILQDRVK